MSNLAQRVITAVIMLAVLFAVLFLLPVQAAAAIFGVVVLVAAWEWSGFAGMSGQSFRLGYMLVTGLLAILPVLLTAPAVATYAIYAGVFGWLLVIPLLFLGAGKFPAWLVLLFGWPALLPAWFAAEALLTAEQGASLFLICLAIVAAADIGAYFVGKNFGSRKLAPAISPGKTIEGLAGGLLAAVAVSLALAEFTGTTIVDAMILGVAIGAISVAGDLWVSRFKRAAGLKDSSHLLPGHGGILDRIDGLIAALPLFALFSYRAELIGL